MANVDRSFGLRAVEHLDGSPYNGATRRVFIPDTVSDAVFIGSPVKSLGNGDENGVATVTLATPGDALLGVVISFDPNRDDLSKQYREGSTGRYAYVVTAPDVIFEIQEDADAGALAATNIGDNANLTAESGSTVSGLSTVELDSSSAGTGTQVRILGFVQREDNEIGDNAKVRVLIVDHELK